MTCCDWRNSAAQPSALIMDGRTLQSTPDSGSRTGYDGHKKKKGSKVHIAVDTLGNLLALDVTPASDQECNQVAELATAVQQVTSQTVTLAYVDQGIPARNRLPMLQRMRFNWMSSSIRRRRGDLYFSHAAGLSNAPSAGSPASTDWLATTNVWWKLSPPGTGWPAPFCYSIE